MNKELYLQREKEIKKEKELYYIVRHLQTFLKENEQNFKHIDSIKSLKKIKEYLEEKEQEYQDCQIREKYLFKELYNTCQHEIAIKYANRVAYECLICGTNIDKNRNIIESTAQVCIDTTNDYKVAYIIEDIFKDIVNSDKDLIETITSKLEELQYDRNIKIKRRTK